MMRLQNGRAGTAIGAFATMLLGNILLVQDANGQNLFRDYFSDEPRAYAAEDYDSRGWLYRVHAGYAGLFRHCDDDAAKRCSPYIYWQQRQNLNCIPRSERLLPLASDQINEGMQRVADGAGYCATPGGCDGRYARLVPTIVNGFSPGRHCQTCQLPNCQCTHASDQGIAAQIWPNDATPSELMPADSMPTEVTPVDVMPGDINDQMPDLDESYFQDGDPALIAPVKSITVMPASDFGGEVVSNIGEGSESGNLLAIGAASKPRIRWTRQLPIGSAIRPVPESQWQSWGQRAEQLAARSETEPRRTNSVVQWIVPRRLAAPVTNANAEIEPVPVSEPVQSSAPSGASVSVENRSEGVRTALNELYQRARNR